ncbi:MAG: family 43 glycosylhydrolase [bacterium]
MIRLHSLIPIFLMCTSGLQAANPLFPDLAADPSVHEFHGKFYIYPTHDEPGGGAWTTHDFHVYSSPDLVKWTDHGVAFARKDVKWLDGDLWAPDCIEQNGKYYLYYAVHIPKADMIGVAVSDSPTGPFTDPLGKPLVIGSELKGGRAIDPCIFIDDDGQAYLFFGNGKFHVVKLKSDMVTREGEILPVDVKDSGEGPWIHKHNGIYYLSYPTGVYKGPSKNQVMVYSMAANPLGPWKYGGTIIYDNGGGNVHGSITQFGSQGYVFYHRRANSPGVTWQRQVYADYLEYNPDGTIKEVIPTKTGVVLKP